MSKKEKLLARISNNPKQVSFEDLDAALTWYGFVCRQPRSGSSHHIYVLGTRQISVPYKRPHVGEVYVNKVLAILAEIDEDNVGSGAED